MEIPENDFQGQIASALQDWSELTSIVNGSPGDTLGIESQ